MDRSYIYSHPYLLTEILARRSTTLSRLAPCPAADRATIASLQARLTSAHEEIARLKAENRTVRERLTIALGDTWHEELAGTQRANQQPPRMLKLAAERSGERQEALPDSRRTTSLTSKDRSA